MWSWRAEEVRRSRSWGPMCRVLYRFLALLARLAVRSGRSKDLEIIVLRHQITVLRDLEVGVGFLRGGARPPTQMMVAFIDACREDFGVEPICAQLPIAPSSYYDAKSRPVSARARRHAAMTAVLVALWAANYRVYGARKLWLAARRAGHEIGRDQVAALMRAAGICGVTRRRRARTTVRDPGAERPGDLVNRDFTARSPNRLWVTDLTVAPTRTGAAYVCFIVDAFSRLIVGWRVAAHMRTEMVLDAVEMARRGRGARIEGLTVHSDA